MKYDLEFLASCLCCVPKFQYIYNVMSTLTIDELKVLRYDLRKLNGKNLNSFLEMEFKNKIGE